METVAVVSARLAYPDYLRHGIYVCQSGRQFRDVQRLGFYTAHAIKPEVPAVLAVFDRISADDQMIDKFSEGTTEEEARVHALLKSIRDDRLDIIRRMFDGYRESTGKFGKFFVLSRVDDARTAKLDHPIENDKLTTRGDRAPWVQMQRYVTMENLSTAVKTSDLVTL